MKPSRRKFEELSWVLGVHSVALRVYRATKGRRMSRRRAGLRNFYSSLLRKDDLVFDIGANLGQYAEAMESGGARVVAIEPNQDCVRHIQLSYGNGRIETIQAAVGGHNGLARIHISDSHDEFSTLSSDWEEAIMAQHDNFAGRWNRTLTVPMVTLDSVAEQHGAPYYIKIDVEGSEESVLDGLSVQPPVLSFEFNLAFLKSTFACIGKPLFGGNCEFNFVWGDEGDSVHFELANWVGPEQLKSILRGMDTRDRNGDIFVRKPGLQQL